MSTATGGAYRSMEGRSRWARALLVATIAVALVGAVSGALQIALLVRAEHGLATTADGAANDSRQHLVAILQLGTLLVCAVAFLAWFRGACRNLGPLGGRDLKYEPDWAVRGFLIPFLNAVRPHSVMTELWHGSDPATLASDVSEGGPAVRGKRSSPGLVDGWWILFIGSGILGQAHHIVMRSAGSSLEAWKTASWLSIATDVATAIGCALAIRIVATVTEWQGLRAIAVRESTSAPSATS